MKKILLLLSLLMLLTLGGCLNESKITEPIKMENLNVENLNKSLETTESNEIQSLKRATTGAQIIALGSSYTGWQSINSFNAITPNHFSSGDVLAICVEIYGTYDSADRIKIGNYVMPKTYLWYDNPSSNIHRIAYTINIDDIPFSPVISALLEVDVNYYTPFTHVTLND